MNATGQMFDIGETVEIDGALWICNHWTPTHFILTRIPDGETAMTMGRTWDDMEQPKRLISRETEGRQQPTA